MKEYTMRELFYRNGLYKSVKKALKTLKTEKVTEEEFIGLCRVYFKIYEEKDINNYWDKLWNEEEVNNV